jgi:N-acetyl-anhydromuramyl-L-alanine amidase AmpD
MMFDSAQLWRKFSYSGGLLLMSGLIGTTVVKQILSADSRSSTASNLNQRNSRPEQITIVPPRVINPLNQQLTALHQLYIAAPKWSVDKLIKREDAKLEHGSSRENAFQAPSQYKIEAHRSNFGDRLSRNLQGKLVKNKLLVVLHETTSAASGAVNTALTPHSRDEDQVSYHAIICQDGTIIYLVDPRKRAYGAGNSVFKWREGFETVQTNKRLKSSVNNFAYHISLETPPDGYNEQLSHSGYSTAQYHSLAWLISHSGIENHRVTTHFAVDRLGERQDPRSFEMDWLRQNLALQGVIFASTDTTP